MTALETALYEVSRFFLAPVLIVLAGMFAYGLFAFGALLFDMARSAAGRTPLAPLARYAARRGGATREQLELQVLKLLEPLRLVSRVAPMLGLVATMIPMGPALVAVTSGNAQGVAQHLVVAFSAVIVALLAASLTFVALTVRRRWLLAELHEAAR